MKRRKASDGTLSGSSSTSLPKTHYQMNSRRYVYLILGYYVAVLLIRSTAGKNEFVSASPNVDFGSNNNPVSSDEFVEDSAGQSHVDGDDEVHVGAGGTGQEGHKHEEKKSHGIQITKVDFEHVETPFIIGLWILCASLAKIVFHMAPRLSHIFPESSLLIVVGVLIGLLLFHTGSVHVSPLTPPVFFYYLLPPIILDAGYFMPNRLFFNNLGTILLFAVIGTLWNTFTIGASLYGLSRLGWFGMQIPLLQTLLFSALISAVDPVAVLAVFEEIHVNEVLYIVVFGESLLNDAVTVVLYHMFEEYAVMGAENVDAVEVVKGVASFPVVALGGTAIGIIWGFLTGFLTRFTNHVRVIEPIFVFVMAYLAYLCAETFHMSGILSITFCGITMKNYVEANISQKSHTVVKYAMKMLSSSSETIIFMFLGVSTIHDNHVWNTMFVVATIVFCSIWRAVGVIMFTMIANRFRLHTLSIVDQFVMSYGGLRGAVAFALVLLIKDETVHCDKEMRRMFITTTIAVIYFTVFIQGITIKPLVQWLRVKKAEKRKPTMNERIHERLMDHSMSVIEKILGTYGHNNLRNKFKHFDNTYIRPCLIRDLKGAEPKIIETYSRLVMQDAMDMMNRGGSCAQNLNKLSSESMAQLLRSQQFESGTTLHGAGSSNHLSPSSAQIQPQPDQWNLDLQELEYNLSKKDMSDAKIHHLLSEELYKPSRRQRRLSYSRHTVDDADLVTEPQLNFKAPITFKKMVSHRRNLRQRGGRYDGQRRQLVDNRGFSLDEGYLGRARDGDDPGGTDGGIYFIAGGSSLSLPVDSDYNVDWKKRRWSELSQLSSATVFTDKLYMEPNFPHTSIPIDRHIGRRYSQASSKNSDYDDTPTVQESLPWRRDSTYHAPFPKNSLTGASGNQNRFPRIIQPNNFPGGNGPMSRLRPARRMSKLEEQNSTSPPAQTTLPWKRDDEDAEEFPVRQEEFPAWSSNKEYVTYNSPTNTYLGGLDRNNRGVPTVIGMFKRDSVSSSPGSRRESLNSLQQERLGSPRHSVGSSSSGQAGSFDFAEQQQQETSPTHAQQPVKKTSIFAMSIPEEAGEDSERDPITDVSQSRPVPIPQRLSLQEQILHEESEPPTPEPPPEEIKLESEVEGHHVTANRRKIGTAGFPGSAFSIESKAEEESTPKPSEPEEIPVTTTDADSASTKSSSDPKVAQTQL